MLTVISNRCSLSKAVMAGSSSSRKPEDLLVKLFGNDKNIDIEKTTQEYVTVMKKKYKREMPAGVLNSLDALVKEYTLDFRMCFDVQTVDFDDTATESSSGTDSPPEPKKRKRHEKLSKDAAERYINRLNNRMRKFLFYKDGDKCMLNTDYLKRSFVRRFIRQSNFSNSEIKKCIVFITPTEDSS
ncbi:uncharacterized protein LOC135843969 [Planococcus citri]|uniref:uncharacterized protein LOC135843969 n=1 Tax=Planococcus citri TaxID=170843 RepID=UPI0031F9F052